MSETGDPRARAAAAARLGAVITHLDDGRYAHVPQCNERCNEDGHWLKAEEPQASPR